MRIILIRHAPSLGQKDSANYAKFGDSNVPLDPAHDHLIMKCGEFLKTYFDATDTKDWPLVWTSQFERAQQTWGGIEHGLKNYFNDKATWHIDTLLNEQSFGFLPFIEGIENLSDAEVAKAARDFSKQMYAVDPYSNPAFMGESPRDVVRNVRLFMDGTLQRDVDEGRKDHMIISHGAVMKAFMMHWFHLYDRESWKALDTPGNCDVIVIEGEKGNWSVKKIYDGERAQSLLDHPINLIEGILRPNERPTPLPPSLQ